MDREKKRFNTIINSLILQQGTQRIQHDKSLYENGASNLKISREVPRKPLQKVNLAVPDTMDVVSKHFSSIWILMVWFVAMGNWKRHIKREESFNLLPPIIYEQEPLHTAQ